MTPTLPTIAAAVRVALILACAGTLCGCAGPTGVGRATPEAAAAAPRPNTATIQACRRDAPAHSTEVQFPGAFRAFELTRDATAAGAPAPPSAVLEQWAAILCNYDLAHLTGELRYLGPSDQAAGRVAWHFRITTTPAGQPLRSATYDLTFATGPDGSLESTV